MRALHVLRCFATLNDWRASRRVSYEQQHTAKKFPLLRSDVYTIEGKIPSEILLGMGSCRLQTFARSLGAQSAISIPAGTERRGRPLRCMYIYLSKYLYDTVAINVLYAYEAQNFAPVVEIENASFASSSP